MNASDVHASLVDDVERSAAPCVREDHSGLWNHEVGTGHVERPYAGEGQVVFDGMAMISAPRGVAHAALLCDGIPPVELRKLGSFRRVHVRVLLVEVPE